MNFRAAIFTLLPLAALATGCSKQSSAGEQGFNGSVQDKMVQYGCPTCHVIPGVPGAGGKVGPSLDELAQRSFIAGRLANDQTNLQLWLMHPQHFEPGTAMPEMGVTPGDAQQIATYLERVD